MVLIHPTCQKSDKERIEGNVLPDAIQFWHNSTMQALSPKQATTFYINNLLYYTHNIQNDWYFKALGIFY